MANKPSIMDKYAEVEEILRDNGHEELGDFIAERAAMHAKKSANRAPTPRQVENADIGAAIVQFMTDHAGKRFQVKDIIAAVPECAGLQNQRVAKILPMFPAISRVTDKGTTYFVVDA